MPKNIDSFNVMAGLIFQHLYERFPLRVTLDETAFITDDGVAEDWLENYFAERSLYSSTVTWLRDAGYIWIDSSDGRSHVFTNCVLSPKGFEALKATPAGITGKSFGESLKAAVANSAVESLKSISSELITQSYKSLAGLATAHLGSALSGS